MNSDAQSQDQISFAIIGDFGQTAADETFPIDQIGQILRAWSPDFIISVGDDNYVLGSDETIDVNIGKNFTEFIYPKGKSPNSNEYPYPSNAPKYNRFLSALGNHDYADFENDLPPTIENIANSVPYINYFEQSLKYGTSGIKLGEKLTVTLPNGQSFSEPTGVNTRFYDVVQGPVHMFFLDSNPCTPYQHGADQIQGKWLKKRLAESTAAWKLVIFHHPPYTSGSGSTEAKYMRWPFQAWGADAVITGHVHNYERSACPDVDTPAGPTIPYIVNGAGGFIPEEGFMGPYPHTSKVRIEEYGFSWVTADQGTLTFFYYDRSSILRDTITLHKNPPAAQSTVELDQLVAYAATVEKTIPITIIRGGRASFPLDVTYKTAPGSAKPGIDYKPAYGVVHFNANQTTATIQIGIIGEQTVPTTTFYLTLAPPIAPTILGPLSLMQIRLCNMADNPLNNTEAFIKRTYLDLLVRQPTSAELSAAYIYLKANPKEKFITDIVLSDTNYANEPVFKVAQIHGAMYWSPEARKSKAILPITYADMDFWTRKLADEKPPLWRIAEGFGTNILELLYFEHSYAKTLPREFIEAVYILMLDQKLLNPWDADFEYWLNDANPPVTNEAMTRYAMVASMATKSFDPPPKSGMTKWNLTKSNKILYLVETMAAGLNPNLQMSPAAIDSIVKGIEQKPAVLQDFAKSLLASPYYISRFLPGPPLPPVGQHPFWTAATPQSSPQLIEQPSLQTTT